ncbi:hypothetical protein TpMuguga_01g00689 [Theileria parva strain Muguga]|uniref:uncharacterized protein n=1 Tax=Theileria parva strain Muguga TaxID=333668 RepID=UPI001C62149D|nr:uncharacterized protein TpMuguga_01g00689 [Theileria parva strain Muguga]EAN33927.2 hypothetical protein TpMuguga_01g00689 [Theileria parva strain Muguga]
MCSDFVGTEDWLMLSENNLTCLTRSRPADSFQFITLKNFCNQLTFKCYVQMGENSIGGLMIRCNGPDKTLIELNSVTKTISLKLLKFNHTLTLLEIPHRGIEVGLNHLLEVSDDGSGGVVRAMIDGEEVFVKENLPTQLTGSMGIYITTGNVTFGNITILPL